LSKDHVHHAPTPISNLPDRQILVLQGGGALGSYQAGVFEGLASFGVVPKWVAGISIGAINAAIIAGNPPETRVDRLREFWEQISSGLIGEPAFKGTQARTVFNEVSANLAAAFGLPGFFVPRFPPPFFHPAGAREALSMYDTGPLKETLERLVDFDRLNHDGIRLSVGAVNVRTGNFVYFDSERQTIGPEHIMASGALPPGFPPVEIDGEFYWDGGIVSNTPLQYVLDGGAKEDTMVFQVDLFSARGPMPKTLMEAAEREKDIRFSSRTRLNTDDFNRMHVMRTAFHRLYQKLPEELQNDPDAQFLAEAATPASVTIVHLIHRRKNYETQSKDYEFSRASVREHWAAGINDVRRTVRHASWSGRESRPGRGLAVFDLTRDARD